MTFDAHGVSRFIKRWSVSRGSEHAVYQQFFVELCDLLGVPRPDPSAEARQILFKPVSVKNPSPPGPSPTGRGEWFSLSASWESLTPSPSPTGRGEWFSLSASRESLTPGPSPTGRGEWFSLSPWERDGRSPG